MKKAPDAGVAAPLEPLQFVDEFTKDCEGLTEVDKVLMAEIAKGWAAAVSKNPKAERERDAAVVTLRAMCGDEHWETMGRIFEESLAKIENDKKLAENLQEELTRAEDYLYGRECARCGGKVSGSNWKAALRYMGQHSVRCVGCHGAAGAWRPYGIMGLQARILELEKEITALELRRKEDAEWINKTSQNESRSFPERCLAIMAYSAGMLLRGEITALREKP